MSDPVIVVVYLGDRTQRLLYDRVLRAAGYGVRLASRPAEFAKATGDGRAQLLVHDDHAPIGDAVRVRMRVLTVHRDTDADALLTQLRDRPSVSS